MGRYSKPFWDSVDKSAGPEACWPWTGQLTRGGYGQATAVQGGNRTHRFAYEDAVGPIPPGEGHHGTVVMHTCDNRKCCNPAHLRLGTQRDNLADMQAKGRKASTAGEVHYAAKLCVEDVKFIRAQAALGVTQTTLRVFFGMSAPALHHVISRRTWKSVP